MDWQWPWFGPTMIFWVAIAAIAICGSYFSHRAKIAKYKMMETLAEKGQSLPANLTPELLDAVSRGDRYGNPVQSGIFLMCIGIALAVFFWALGGGGDFFQGEHVPNWLPVIGIFPFMVGLAKLLGAAFNRRPPSQ